MSTPAVNLRTGFTLIEMAIVITIIGVLTLPLLVLYKSMTENKLQEDTKARLKNMNSLMTASFESQYDMLTGKSTYHYPCPSDRALSPTDPNYRRQFNNGLCSLAQLAAMPAPLVYVQSMTPQPPVCTPNFGFCIVQGNDDKDGDPGLDPILIGGIPIRDLLKAYVDAKGDPFPESYVLDGWGSNFDFAVSYNLVTYSDTYSKNDKGVISVTDENNQNTAGINDDAHYVIVSHGPDRKGAYSASGAITVNCGTAATALDSNNCDNDSRFRSALGRFDAKLPTFFDDYLVAYTRRETGIWEAVGSTGSIHNLNKKNVGIGTATPTAKLEVNGDIRADYDARASAICKKDASGNPVDCFNIEAITGSGIIECPNTTAPADPATYTIMRGITNGRAICAAPPTAATTAKPSTSCPAGQFISSINLATGIPICIN
ncbi:MAG: prepilin-type N-terminal cleavage/methylation domain protein [Micavibrio sp.]|nr:prepilin-type N-terminal cleavage/methylation domain protein [Micavibrio sp.]